MTSGHIGASAADGTALDGRPARARGGSADSTVRRASRTRGSSGSPPATTPNRSAARGPRRSAGRTSARSRRAGSASGSGSATVMATGDAATSGPVAPVRPIVGPPRLEQGEPTATTMIPMISPPRPSSRNDGRETGLRSLMGGRVSRLRGMPRAPRGSSPASPPRRSGRSRRSGGCSHDWPRRGPSGRSARRAARWSPAC